MRLHLNYVCLPASSHFARAFDKEFSLELIIIQSQTKKNDSIVLTPNSINDKDHILGEKFTFGKKLSTNSFNFHDDLKNSWVLISYRSAVTRRAHTCVFSRLCFLPAKGNPSQKDISKTAEEQEQVSSASSLKESDGVSNWFRYLHQQTQFDTHVAFRP